jgi:DNA polymerase (family X)
MTNPELASLFDELADIMEIAGENYFKIRAYRKASEVISATPEDVLKMSPETLQDIPGIGKAIAGKIRETGEKGTFATLEKWRQTSFASLRPLLDISGFTIKILRLIIKDLKISSMDDLKMSIADGRFLKYDKIDGETKNTIIKIAV